MRCDADDDVQRNAACWGRFYGVITVKGTSPHFSCAVKGAGQQWVRVPPGNWIAPPGSNRSSGGSNEAAEASDVEGREGDLASMQAVM